MPDQGKSEQYKERCRGKDQCPREPETYNTHQDDDGCPDIAIQVQSNKIVVLQVVNFYLDETRIKEESMPLLDEVVTALREHKEIKKIRIEGHTDLRAGAAYNLKLSKGRAKAVFDYLVAHGVEATRLQHQGYGSTKPIHRKAKDENEHLANRRVEFSILERAE